MLGATSLVAVLVAAPICGPLDLPTAQALAVARSEEVAIRRSEVGEAEADRAVARGIRWLPEFNTLVTGGVVPGARLKPDPATGVVDPNNITSIESGSNRGLSELGAFMRIEVNALQPLWTWGRISAAGDAADAIAQARGNLLQSSSDAIRHRVLGLVMGIRLLNKLLGIAGDVESALKDVDARVQKSLKANDGEISPEDRYRIELFRSDLTEAKAEVERRLRLGRVGLAATLALEVDKLELREEPLPDTGRIVEPDLVQALADAERLRPDLKALDNGIRAKEAQSKATWAEMFPQLGLVGQFAWSRAAGRDTVTNPYVGDYFNALTVGGALVIKQNLSFWNVAFRANKVDAELKTLRDSRRAALRGIEVQVQEATANLHAAIIKKAATAKAVATGRSWFRSATLNFGVGVGESRDLIDAYRGYVEAQKSDAQATLDLLVADDRIREVTGRTPPDPVLNCVMP